MANAIIEDRYEIIRLIGEGGMANVYLAKDTILNRLVAIKVLRGDLTGDEVSVRRFQREAIAATTLSHPNIVDVYDVGRQQGRYFIVMEYVEGNTLKDLLNKRGHLSVIEAVDILKQLSSALMQAHIHGIVHRDIKPQNILVNDAGVAKITDFGIATAQHMAQLTQSDTIMGSLHYLAPEVARGEQATNQADIYALGVVLYELLVGVVPFDGETPVNIAFKHIREPMPSIRLKDPSVPQSVENIITKATAKSLKNRYQNAEELLADLVTCLQTDHSHDKKIELKDDEIENESEAVEKKDEKNSTLAKKVFYGSFAVLVVVILSVIAMLLSQLLAPPKKVEVPDVVGMTQVEAQRVIEKSGLTMKVERWEASLEYEKNIVIRTNPSSGLKIPVNGEVRLTVSSGLIFVADNYVGKRIEDVKPMLESKNILVSVQYEFSQTVPKGEIMRQTPAPGFEFQPDAQNRITFTVSEGVQIIVPNVIGMSIDEASRVISEAGLTPKLNELTLPTDENVAKNTERNRVTAQSPTANSKVNEKGVEVFISYYPEDPAQ